MKITIQCKGCEKNIVKYECQPRVYCTRSCYLKKVDGEKDSFVCEVCGKIKTIPKYYNDHARRFCSLKCAWKGDRTRTRVTKNCLICGKEMILQGWMKEQKYCSYKCMGEARKNDSFRGKNSGNWKGGTGSNWKNYGGTYVSSLRKSALERDGNRCTRCGSEKNICTHHKDRNRKNNVLENLETLCLRCHHLEHGYHKTKQT